MQQIKETNSLLANHLAAFEDDAIKDAILRIFQTPAHVKCTDFRELTRAFAATHAVSVQDVTRKTALLCTLFEQSAYFDTALSTHLLVHYVFFGASVLLLGNSSQSTTADLLKRIDDGSATGCFALSEQGFGSSSSGVSTTATLSAAEGGWQLHLNSTHETTHKHWVINGLSSQYAIVFANLLVAQSSTRRAQNLGLHTFVVDVQKNAATVSSESMGPTFGQHSLNFARMSFKQTPLSLRDLLSNFCELSVTRSAGEAESGAADKPTAAQGWKTVANLAQGLNYRSKLANGRERTEKNFAVLHYARIFISAQMLSATRLALHVAVRYAHNRRVVAANGHSENVMAHLGLFQDQVLPALAHTLTLSFAFNEFKTLLSAVPEQDSEKLARLAMVFKVLSTQHAREVGQLLVERVGGQGYLRASQICDLVAYAHWGITGAGDNSMLLQRLAREIVLGIGMQKLFLPVLSMRRKNLKNIDHFTSSETLLDLLKAREITMERKLTQKTKEQAKVTGNTLVTLFTLDENHLVLALANTFSLRSLFELSLLNVQKRVTPKQKYTSADEEQLKLLKALVKLALICAVQQELPWYLIAGLVNAKAVQNFANDRKSLVRELAAHQLEIVQAFNIPQCCLTAPILADNYAEIITTGGGAQAKL